MARHTDTSDECLCGHRRRFHGRGKGKCWATRRVCTCQRFAGKPAEAAEPAGDAVHVLDRLEVLLAFRGRILIDPQEVP